MVEFLSNPWFIGIGGGILSGLVVTFITRYLFSRRDNREYAQRIVTANQEILYAVRPGISEGVIPSQDIVSSLVNATASKYRVDPKDLYNLSNLADVLVKEVMDSSFLSASSKMEFCEKLGTLKHVAKTKAEQGELAMVSRRLTQEFSEYRQRAVTMMSTMLGVMAMVMTVFAVFYKQFDMKKFDSTFAPAIAAVITIMVAFVATNLFWVMKRIDRKRREEMFQSIDKVVESVRIKELDGKIRRKGTNPPGNEPCPPKDKEQ